jgi:hypothetical protein
MTDGAFEELTLTGQIGMETVELLRQLARQVTRTSGFPPPEGHERWSDDAVDDLLAAMLARDGAGQRFVLTCFGKAHDQASLERLLLTSIRNYLIDEAKKTPRGKLRRRFAERLQADPRYRHEAGPPPCWALVSQPTGTTWQGDIDDLINAAWRVRGVAITRWNTSGPTPQATVTALMTVLDAVVGHAQGAVREEDLAKVLEARFELLASPEFVSLHGEEGALLDPTFQLAAGRGADLGRVQARASEVWRTLTEDERALLPYLDQGEDEDHDGRHAAQLLEIGPVQAEAILDGLYEKLRVALEHDKDQFELLGALLSLTADPPPASGK